MSHQSEIICCAQTGRTAADNSNFFAGIRSALRNGNISGMVYGIAFQTAYVYRIVKHVSSAARFARMLAYECTC